jgi:hypothetical protein
MAGEGDACARVLQQSYSANGQAYISTALEVMAGISTQDEATVLFSSISTVFRLNPEGNVVTNSVDEVRARSEAAALLHPLTRQVPALRNEISAVFLVGQYGDALLTPVFARSDAVGTVLRKRIEPVMTPLAAALRRLLQ